MLPGRHGGYDVGLQVGVQLVRRYDKARPPLTYLPASGRIQVYEQYVSPSNSRRSYHAHSIASK